MKLLALLAVVLLAGCTQLPDSTPPEERPVAELQSGPGHFGFFHRFYDREENIVCYARYSAISCVKRDDDAL